MKTFKQLFIIFLFLIGMSLTFTGAQDFPTIKEIMEYSDQDLDPNRFLQYNDRKGRFLHINPVIWGYYPAGSLTTNRGTALTLSAETDGSTPKLEFINSPASYQYLGFNIILPPFSYQLTKIHLYWYAADATAGDVLWVLDWCETASGEDSCAPDGTNSMVVSSGSSSTGRNDIYFDVKNETFPQLSTLVVNIYRKYDDFLDTYEDTASVEGIAIQGEVTNPTED